MFLHYYEHGNCGLFLGQSSTHTVAENSPQEIQVLLHFAINYSVPVEIILPFQRLKKAL